MNDEMSGGIRQPDDPESVERLLAELGQLAEELAQAELIDPVGEPPLKLCQPNGGEGEIGEKLHAALVILRRSRRELLHAVHFHARMIDVLARTFAAVDAGETESLVANLKGLSLYVVSEPTGSRNGVKE